MVSKHSDRTCGRKNGRSVWRHSCKCEVMNDDTTRAVSLTRLGHGRYEAVNAHGGTIEFSTDRQTFTPVELFLASIAGCTRSTSTSSPPSVLSPCVSRCR